MSSDRSRTTRTATWCGSPRKTRTGTTVGVRRAGVRRCERPPVEFPRGFWREPPTGTHIRCRARFSAGPGGPWGREPPGTTRALEQAEGPVQGAVQGAGPLGGLVKVSSAPGSLRRHRRPMVVRLRSRIAVDDSHPTLGTAVFFGGQLSQLLLGLSLERRNGWSAPGRNRRQPPSHRKELFRWPPPP